MAISEDFKNAVEQNKTTRVRIMLKDRLIIDPSAHEFDEMFKYAKDAIPDLVDSHDGEVFKTSDDWDEDYLNNQMVAVVNNFSAERIVLLKGMVKELYGQKNKVDNAENKIERTVSYKEQSKTGANGTKIVGGYAAVVGAALLICAIAGVCILLKK